MVAHCAKKNDMAQANIKERIKEMRLRVLAEPLENVTVQGVEPHLDAEIETVMLEHPDVGTAAVVGVDDKKFGKIGFGFLTAKGDKRINCCEMDAWLRRELANYKVPKRLKVLDQEMT